tara:strand:- start:401 stop:595 length:195 start_codon:yes stop_codon:yes gene_type:complete
MTTRIQQIKESLQTFGADPYQIAAEAIERGDRLAAHVNRLQKALSQVPDAKAHEQQCFGLCSSR